MSETLNVDSYDETLDFFRCTDESGKKRRLDLITSGCLPEGTKPEDIVGKKVTVGWTHPFLEMAEEVEIIGS